MARLPLPASAADFEFNLFGTELSLGLWLLAASVALVAAHVGLAWVRLAQARPGLARSWGRLLLAATALGGGICAAVLLTIAAEPWPFWLGFRASAAWRLWLGAVLGCLPVVLALSYKPGVAGLVLCGALLALVAAGLQVGWVVAAGFLPGAVWPLHWVVAGVLLMALGFAASLVLGLRAAEALSAYRRALRICAALLLGASLFVGQEMLMLDAGLPRQRASAYANQVPEHVMNLVCGGVVPTVLVLMAVYLELHRRQRNRRKGSATPMKRRKRRHRPRVL